MNKWMSPKLSRRLAKVTPILREVLPRDLWEQVTTSTAQSLRDLPPVVQELVVDIEKIEGGTANR